MLVDRYLKVVLTVIAVALVVIAARPLLETSGALESLWPSPALAQVAVPKYELTIPKSWGKYIAYSNNNLLLEASDRTWRVVDIDGKPPEFPRIKVLIHWQ